MVPVQQNDRVLVGKEYIVEANDSLQSIATRFGTTAEEIVRFSIVTIAATVSPPCSLLFCS